MGEVLPTEIFQFENFELDLGRYELRRGDRVVKLEKHPLELLILLVENQGRLVTREEIGQRLWGDDVYVDTRHGINTAVHKLRNALRDDSDQPHILETVVGKGYRLIAQVVPGASNGNHSNGRPDPAVAADAPASPSAFNDDATEDTPYLRKVVPDPHQPRPRASLTKILVATLFPVLLLILGAGVFRVWQKWPITRALEKASSHTAVRPATPRRSIAVIGCQNLAGQPSKAWLSSAISDMLTTEMAAGEQIRMISGEKVARAKIGLSLPMSDSYSSETLVRLEKGLGIDYVIVGSYYDLGGSGKIRLGLRLEDASSEELITSIAATGTEADLPSLVSVAAAQLRLKLGIGELAPADNGNLRPSLPSTAEVAQLYSEGLARLRVFDAPHARDLLLRAVSVDPKFALSHSALAEAWWALGYDEKARQEGKRAVDSSSGLPREEKFAIEGRYREYTHEWSREIEIYRTLFDLFPDSLEYGLSLARAQRNAGQTSDALATLDSLRKSPLLQKDDPRIDIEDVALASAMGDFKREEVVSARAVEKAQAQGERLLKAQARLGQARAFRRAGKGSDATFAYEDAGDLFQAAGDLCNSAAALNGVGAVQFDQGNTVAAEKIYRQTLVTYEHCGSESGLAITHNNLGNALQIEGRFRDAARSYQAALDTDRNTDSKNHAADVLNNYATMVQQEGQLKRARDMFQRSFNLYRDVGNQGGVALTLNNMALLLTELGELDASEKASNQGLDIKRGTKDKHNIAFLLFGLAQARMARGDLRQAKEQHEQALALRIEIGELESAAESQLELAHLALEERRYQDARQLAQAASDAFKKTNTDDLIGEAQVVLVQVLMAEGKLQDAGPVMRAALAASQKVQRPEVRFPVAITAARLSAAAAQYSPRDVNDSLKALQAVLAEATKDGYLGYAFEVRLAEGEIEMRSGRTAAASAHLNLLQSDSTSKGFLLIARKAEKALNI